MNKLTLWKQVADGIAPLPAGKVNVRHERHGEPLVRRVTSCEWQKRKDGRWLFVRWETEPRPDNIPDCGYSGIREDCEYLADWGFQP